MGKPGKQQKPVEKAEKKIIQGYRSPKPYTRRSAKGKSKSTLQVPAQPGPFVLPQQPSPDLMTLD